MEIIELPGLTRANLAQYIGEQFQVGAEIGVQKGEYSEALLGAGVLELTLVDLWARQNDYFDIANVSDADQQRNLRETIQRVQRFISSGQTAPIIISHSTAAATLIKDGSLDFIYLDADHKQKAVEADLVAWYPKVRAGGLISGHDYLDSPNCCGSEFGVKTAVTNFCKEIGVKEIYVCQSEPFPNWHFIKPKLNL